MPSPRSTLLNRPGFLPPFLRRVIDQIKAAIQGERTAIIGEIDRVAAAAVAQAVLPALA